MSLFFFPFAYLWGHQPDESHEKFVRNHPSQSSLFKSKSISQSHIHIITFRDRGSIRQDPWCPIGRILSVGCKHCNSSNGQVIYGQVIYGRPAGQVHAQIGHKVHRALARTVIPQLHSSNAFTAQHWIASDVQKFGNGYLLSNIWRTKVTRQLTKGHHFI